MSFAHVIQVIETDEDHADRVLPVLAEPPTVRQYYTLDGRLLWEELDPWALPNNNHTPTVSAERVERGPGAEVIGGQR